MKSYVYNLNEHLTSTLSEVGGKAANLIQLANIDSINVPKGFCITTTVYKEVFKDNNELRDLLDKLSMLNINELDSIKEVASQIRNIIVSASIPKNIVDEIRNYFLELGEDKFYAVRSSATAEDLPTASFAGQHDTYLNIVAFDNILEHISKCWASLFTDRAIAYRIKNGFDHRKVFLAVVIQEMINSDASGVMFTVDPITSNRSIVSIDASIGLGEDFVSGHINSDTYKVSSGEIIDKRIANQQVISDKQILTLESLGRLVESNFSCPRDIEWCINNNQIYIVQSRPVTTLYPLPSQKNDGKHVYVSSGHLQMMTAPIKPLGIFFFKSVISNPPSQEIGGRLFVDITGDISTPIGRKMTKYLLNELGDTLITNAVVKIINNKKLISELPKVKEKVFAVENSSNPLAIMFNAYKIYRKNDPDIVREIINKEEEDIKKMGQELKALSGDKVFDYISNDHDNRRVKIASPLNAGVLTAGLLSARSFDKKIKKWFGESNASDSIIMSIPNSITNKTGLSLMDVTDVIRDYDEVINYLKNPCEKTFFKDLKELEGGEVVYDTLMQYLSEYGMRCSGDIDITLPRWIENPIELVPSILSNLENFKVGASKEKFEEGKILSEKRIQELVKKVEKLSGGKKKAKKIKEMASVIRNYIGFREYPKFSYMKRYYIYKEAMLREGKLLVDKDYIDEVEDIYYLYFDELRAMVNGQRLDKNIILNRKNNYIYYEKLTPPRVMLSDGEIILGEYDNSNASEGALQGLPVSAGIVEGRARIVKNLKDSYLSEGDILVTEFTDPSWTPAFVSIKGLITEVGGLSTHGAIIAREYGLPAVVSVKDATKLIKDGQLIRLNGSKGYIELL